jgi:hypothetical protein
VDGDRHDRDAELVREDRRAFLELLHAAVRRPLALREQDEDLPVSQSVRPGPHGAHQVRVGINRHHVHEPGELPLERGFEVLARADEEHPAERAERQRADEQEHVQEALVIRADEEGAIGRQPLAAGHAEAQEHARGQEDRLHHGERGHRHGRLRRKQKPQILVVGFAGEQVCPRVDLRGRGAASVCRLRPQRLGEVADRVDLLCRLLRHLHVEGVLEAGEELHPLHRVEAEVEFDVRVGGERGAQRNGGPDRGEHPYHVRVCRPELVGVTRREVLHRAARLGEFLLHIPR